MIDWFICLIVCSKTKVMEQAVCKKDYSKRLAKGTSPDVHTQVDAEGDPISLNIVEDPCSNACEKRFVDKCVAFHCKKGRDGPKICGDEVAARKGPLAKVCAASCAYTPRMKAAVCPGKKEEL